MKARFLAPILTGLVLIIALIVWYLDGWRFVAGALVGLVCLLSPFAIFILAEALVRSYVSGLRSFARFGRKCIRMATGLTAEEDSDEESTRR
jgi:hypothetical protein